MQGNIDNEYKRKGKDFFTIVNLYVLELFVLHMYIYGDVIEDHGDMINTYENIYPL